MARESGSQFGPYVIHSLLGAGGMGEVYRARDSRLNRDVALKFVHPGADVRRFQSEARAIAALNHPNIVSIFDVADDYLVTELVDGSSLRTLRPTQREAIDYAAQIADGLAAAHAAGITHRDLKPDNVMVTRDGRVKILDFGLARQTEATGSDATLTQGGIVMGTVAYMSPEQARARPADARSDIFSLGSTVYELLSGRQPFTGDSIAQTMAAVIEKDPPPLPETVPQGLKGIVQRCMEKEPARRFQSAADLAYALRALSSSGTIIGSAVGGRTSVPSRREFPWLSAALGVALAGTLGYFLLRSATAPIALSELPRSPIPIEEAKPGSGLGGESAFSPDGKSILYTALVGDNRQVFLRQLDSPDAQQLTQLKQDAGRPAWAPDMSRFYFSSGRNLFEQSFSGSGAQLVVPNVSVYALTPDGRGTVFIGFESGGFRLQIAHPFGSPPRPLRNFTGLIQPKAASQRPVLAFSPDGRQLLFAYGSTLPIARMIVIPWPEDSGAAREIPLQESTMERHHGSFGWLGDNRHVVAGQLVDNRYRLDFIDTRSGNRKSHFSDQDRIAVGSFDAGRDRLLIEQTRSNWGAWSYSLPDGKLSRIQDTSLSETEPAWSPDGTTLAFLAQYGQEDELWLKNMAAGWKRLLFKASATGDKSARFRAPVFSPDGSRIALMVTLDQAIVPSGYAIYMILPKSGQATRLQGNFGTGLRPIDWSPDGRSIAFRQLGGRLQVLDLESGKLNDLGGSSGNRSPTSWSRDGKWLARIDREGVSLVSPDGKEKRTISKKILTNGSDAPAHCFSADGSRLYLVRSEGDTAKIEELVLATDQLRTLTVLPGSIPDNNFNRGMQLHPDGKSLVFTSGDETTTFWIVDGVTAALKR